MSAKSCEECGQSFIPENGWERFCSDACAGLSYARGYFEKGLAELANNHPRNEKQIAVMKQGVRAGLSEAEITAAVKSHWGEGRQPDARELERAYDVAYEAVGQSPDTAQAPESKEARAKRRAEESARRAAEIEYGQAAALEAMKTLAPEPMSFEELQEKSPFPLGGFCIDDYPGQAAALFLRTLYSPEDMVFCGTDNLYGLNQKNAIRGAYELSESILDGAPFPPFIVCNPLSGELAPTKDGKGQTYRGDNCVSSYRYTVFESDIAPLEIQAAFLWGRIQAGWPIVSITYSGGKSLHALIRVDGIETAEQWKQEIREGLFPFLVTLGADDACANPARLTRFPGYYREDKGKRQTLLWLALPERHTEPTQAHSEPKEVQTSASVFEPFTDADRAYLESVL
jgi:hypothetical protein